MTNLHKNLISFLLGSFFTYLFVWISGLVASLPVPEFIRSYNEFVVFNYSNILVVMLAAIISVAIMLLVKISFTKFTKQHLFYFALPIALFFAYLLVFFNFVFPPLIYAAIPTLLIATLFSKNINKAQ